MNEHEVSPSSDRVTITRLARQVPTREVLAEDVRVGLTGPEKWLRPVHFYDPRGSELYERITELEEYYPTRTEAAILASSARRFVRSVHPHELIELGSGSSTKTGLLLRALREVGGRRYAALEISESALTGAAHRLAADHPWLEVDGYIGDFHLHLGDIPRRGRRLLAFLGSTLGNLGRDEREVLLAQVAAALDPGDGFVLGVDLVKSPEVLLPAYDDAAGVTAEFNRNVLHVINRELGGDLSVDAFDHRAVWDATSECVQMHLVANRDVVAHLDALDLDLRFAAGEHIVTEHSCKFRVAQLTDELAGVGLVVHDVAMDDEARFAVLLAVPAS